ncbi:hypothetical protein ANCDUO_03821 [Ancylostoma duodenale]|uniref:Uncharacterized protein n=1 Tax=Ancylostoma duodenale TaxID=51022 RepID=A0A0C2H8M3_9BILA|nr:hypothetical protein ANCDUO_03821 [Ancylostoma duodenale]
MRLNIKKTEYVQYGEQTPGTILVDDIELPKVSVFKDLGSRISADGSTVVEAEHRANAAWIKWRQIAGVMCDRKMPLKLKSKIYRTVLPNQLRMSPWTDVGREGGRKLDGWIG